MDLNSWARKIHDNACAHGWWEEDRPFSEVAMLVTCEVAEAVEEARAGRPEVWYSCADAIADSTPCRLYCYDDKASKCSAGGECIHRKPEGVAVEMADALIRILDWFGRQEVDVEALVAEKHAYNKSRPYKHGKRF